MQEAGRSAALAKRFTFLTEKKKTVKEGKPHFILMQSKSYTHF